MRHRIGIVLAIAMFAVLFFAGGWGYLRLLRLPAPGGNLTGLPAGGGRLITDSTTITAFAALAGTGLVAGILVALPRISPLAAGLPGLVLLGWTGLYLISVRQGVDLIPLRADPFGAGFEAMLYNGTLAAAGFAMIIPMCLPSRWRRRAVAVQQVPAAAAVTTPDPVIQPTTVTPPATQMERVATGPESPWLVSQRAAPWQGDDK
jgi:hypothetical protein